MDTVTILGAGIAGIAASYHVGHDQCLIYEADGHYGGHGFLDGMGVIRAGRYAQWGYLMTHDCFLRGKKVAEHLRTRAELKDFDIDD